MHIHWHRKVGPVWGPYALTVNGPIGSQLLRCRCGHERWRDEVATREDVQTCYPIKVATGSISRLFEIEE